MVRLLLISFSFIEMLPHAKEVPWEMYQDILSLTGSSEYLHGGQRKDKAVSESYYFPFTIVTHKFLLCPFLEFSITFRGSLLATSEN